MMFIVLALWDTQKRVWKDERTFGKLILKNEEISRKKSKNPNIPQRFIYKDTLQWQEKWVHPEASGFCPHRGPIDAAAVLTPLVELAQALKTPLMGAGP